MTIIFPISRFSHRQTHNQRLAGKDDTRPRRAFWVVTVALMLAWAACGSNDDGKPPAMADASGANTSAGAGGSTIFPTNGSAGSSAGSGGNWGPRDGSAPPDAHAAVPNGDAAAVIIVKPCPEAVPTAGASCTTTNSYYCVYSSCPNGTNKQFNCFNGAWTVNEKPCESTPCGRGKTCTTDEVCLTAYDNFCSGISPEPVKQTCVKLSSSNTSLERICRDNCPFSSLSCNQVGNSVTCNQTRTEPCPLVP